MKVWLRSVLDYFGAEGAQDAFEYVLVLGVVVVGALVVVGTPVGSNLIRGVVDGVCTTINGIDGFPNMPTPPCPAAS